MKAMDNDLARNACFQSSPGYVARLTSMHDPFILNMCCNIVLSGTSCELCASGTCLYNVSRWTPKGQMIVHIHEHKESINRLVVTSLPFHSPPPFSQSSFPFHTPPPFSPFSFPSSTSSSPFLLPSPALLIPLLHFQRVIARTAQCLS